MKIQIDSVKGLRLFLKKEDIDHSQWSGLGNKTIQDLFSEISRGECLLCRGSDDSFSRFMDVVLVTIYYTDPRTLVKYRLRHAETKHRKGSSVIITHGTSTESLSEKRIIGRGDSLVPCESVFDCAKRACREELSWSNREVNSLGFSFQGLYQTSGISRSYPGLPSITNYHSFTVFIPPSLYKPDGYQEKSGLRTIYFEWIKIHNTPYLD